MKEFAKLRTTHCHALYTHHVLFYTEVPQKNYTETKQEEDIMSQQTTLWVFRSLLRSYFSKKASLF